jgi:geranylgeranyl diphosphate synthase type II
MPPEGKRPADLHRAMRYSVFSGGKRIRPALCMMSAAAVGADPQIAVLPGAAVELLHTYTLIHDDLPSMDDDDMRRGKPTCHKVFGEALAILAGDALQTLAFEIAAQTGSATIVTELARAAGSCGVIGGQVEDIAERTVRADAVAVNFVHQHKTADLFCAAVRMGAIAGGASPAQLAALTQYATGIGVAFQITDDVLDADQGPAAADGKPRDGVTCLDVWTPEEAQAEAGRHIQSALAALKSVPGISGEELAAVAGLIGIRKE